MGIPQPGKRVNEIDLLRFIAAMAVVFFHYAFRGYAADGRSIMPYPLLAPVAKYGYLGVELFFLISGFVILMTAARGEVRAFVVSRVVRLYPAFWACCTLTFVAILLIGDGRYSATFGQYLANMTMLSGFAGVRSIDGVYWSLFVEMQFYGLVTLLLLSGRIHQAQSFLLLWLAATVLLVAFPVQKLRFLLITDYAAYFIGGALTYLVWSRGMTMTRLGAIVVAMLVAIYQSVQLEGFTAHFQTRLDPWVVGAIVVGCFAVMLLVATGRMGALGRTRWMLAGALTYPLYLIHQNLGFMIFNRAYPRLDAHVVFWGTIVLVLGIAYAVHVLVERPLAPWLKQRLRTVLDIAAAWVVRLVPTRLMPASLLSTTMREDASAATGVSGLSGAAMDAEPRSPDA